MGPGQTASGGPTVRLNDTLAAGEDVSSFAISGDGARVVYNAVEEVEAGLFSVAVEGGLKVRLNGPAPYKISPDGTTVVYLENHQLYRIPIGRGEPVQLSGPAVYLGQFVIGPDSESVVFDVGRVEPYEREVYSVRFDADVDADGTLFACDCADDDATVSSAPGPVRHLSVSHTGGSGGTTELSWDAPALPGGSASLVYDAVVSGIPLDFVDPDSTHCLESDDGSDRFAIDTTMPPPGGVRYYLVRAENPCGGGSLGETSSGGGRVGRSCP